MYKSTKLNLAIVFLELSDLLLHSLNFEHQDFYLPLLLLVYIFLNVLILDHLQLILKGHLFFDLVYVQFFMIRIQFFKFGYKLLLKEFFMVVGHDDADLQEGSETSDFRKSSHDILWVPDVTIVKTSQSKTY